MSKAPEMVDCPKCSHRDLEEKRGTIRRYINGNKYVIDVCDMCGGSGRIVKYSERLYDRKTIMMKKQQTVVMREWIAQEKELIYGVKND